MFLSIWSRFLHSSKHKHSHSHRGRGVQSGATTVFPPQWFDFGTYLPTAERREQIAHRWALLPMCVHWDEHACRYLCVCVCVHTVSVLFLCIIVPAWIYFYTNMYACTCAFAIRCTAQECLSPFTFSTYLDMQSPLCEGVRCEKWHLTEIWAAVIFRFGISFSVGLTSDGRDLACKTVDKGTVMHDTKAQRTQALLRLNKSQDV